MNDAGFAKLVAILNAGHTPRVWSLLVTVFGDLAQDEDAAISGAVLGHLTDSIGIKPEAMRVALHRLRKDGWIDSAKIGRTSSYFLSPRGRDESAHANPVIYMREQPPQEGWLIVRQSTGQTRPDTEIALGAGLSLANRPDKNALSLPLTNGTAIPDWIAEKICDADLVAQSLRLNRRLSDLRAGLQRAGKLSPIQSAALRVLVIHDWRRLVLKAPLLPQHLFPTRWHGPECGAHVSALLSDLERPELGALERSLAA